MKYSYSTKKKLLLSDYSKEFFKRYTNKDWFLYKALLMSDLITSYHLLKRFLSKKNRNDVKNKKKENNGK